MYQNRVKTQWLGAYVEYVTDAYGVEKRVRHQLVLASVRKPDGTTVRKGEAKNLLQPYLNRVNERLGAPVRERKTATFDEFSAIWERDNLVLSKPSTRSSARTQLKTLRAAFGSKDMRQIGAGEIQQLVGRLLEEGRQPKTIRNLWGTISLIWQAALAQKFVDALLPKPTLPKQLRKKPRYFSISDVGAIIATIPTHGQQRAFYWLIAETGLRAGEIAGLRLEDVLLDRVNVEQAVWHGEVQTPKSQSAIRSIAISSQLVDLLLNQVSRQRAAGHLYLFTVGTGNPLDMNLERARRLHPALAALETPMAGYHAFRHFNVSLMDALRVPLKTIQERIGHALTGSFTLDVYGHAMDWKSNEEAAQKLGIELARSTQLAEAKAASQDFDRLTAISVAQNDSDLHLCRMEVTQIQ